MPQPTERRSRIPWNNGIAARTSGSLLGMGNLRFAGLIPLGTFRKHVCSQLFYGPDRVSPRVKKPLQREVISKLGIMHGSQSSLERQGIGETLFRLLRFALTNSQRTPLFGVSLIKRGKVLT